MNKGNCLEDRPTALVYLASDGQFRKCFKGQEIHFLGGRKEKPRAKMAGLRC